jgi:MFS family permease
MLPYDQPVRRLGVFAFLVAFCEALSFYAASLYAYALTGSVLVVSVVMTAIAIAETLGAVLGGTLADRLDRRMVAAIGGLAGALLLATLALGASVVVLTAVMVLAIIAASPIRPVIGAALPNLVVEGDLRFANGYVQALRNAALTLAPVAAGLGVGIVGARGIFAIAAGSLLLSVLVLVCVRGRFHGVETAAEEVSDSPLAGFALIRRDRVLGAVVIAGALSYLAAAYCSIADLPLAIDDLGAGETGYGLLVAAWGVGTTLGAVVARRAMQRLGVERAFTLALIVEGIAIAAVAFAPSITLAAIAFIAGGMMGGIGITADQVLVQERVADGLRGRVRAANDAVMAAAYSLSLGVGGFVVVALGPRGTYLVGGLGVIGAAFVGMRVLRRPAAAARVAA